MAVNPELAPFTLSRGIPSSDDQALNTIIQLQDCIQQAIQQLNYSSAEFLAELLYAECSILDRSNVYWSEAVYLYVLSLYLNKNYHTAFQISKEFKEYHLGTAFIFGRCALQLSQGLNEAILAILSITNAFSSNTGNNNNAHVNAVLNSNLINIPDLATLNCLLGNLYMKLDHSKESAFYHSEALGINPYLWESYEAICKMRATIDLKRVFFDITKQRNNSHSNNAASSLPTTSLSHFEPRSQPSLYSKTTKNNNNNNNNTNNNTNNNNNNTPFQSSNSPPSTSASSFSSIQHFSRSQQQQQQLNPSIRSYQNKNIQTPKNPTNNNKASYALPNNMSMNLASPSSKQPTISSLAKVYNRNKLLTTPPSKLLSNDRNYQNNNNIMNKTTFKTPRNLYSSTGRLTATKKNSRSLIISNSILTNDYPITLPEIMYNFALILRSSSQYNSFKAIRLFESQIPSHIKDTMPWCLVQLGKLHFEIINYDMSLKYFNRLKDLQPARVRDMEIYSTLLWHLHDKVKSSNLANGLMDTMPNKPETWCCIGNLLSLQKDHDAAIKAFEKATQLDPNFAYAYTLQGHEHSSNDSSDSAKTCYRKALACDPQHYNAYYGLGTSSMKLGQYEEALLYFEKARSINPVNVVLICCCGGSLEKLGYKEKALQYYELACQLQPTSSLSKYKMGQLLYSMTRYNVALQTFEELVKLVPDDATAHYLLGQTYRIVGRKKDAVKELTVAMNLDPKGNQVVIDELQKCHMQE
ncbi:anaphase promoting complex subunit CDC27 [Saccharomyces eubayanus]|uniref:anaphase promoting complex subunit CDC27 n=1 Tax=Saccharomyces eubayanus TaxID=1080349 RepID=UPI0006BFB670|nr:CDC27-like protein [Saccharomyces eubayanus]KOH00769.1 CDC27-like protein [Saccharomyces eubayanus]